MTKCKQYLLATVGLSILVGGLTLLGPVVPQGQAVPPAKDVNVITDGVPFEFRLQRHQNQQI